MTEEQFQQLQALIREQTAEIKTVALAVRSLDRRLTSIEASLIRPLDREYEELGTEPLDELLKLRQSLAPRGGGE